MSDALERLMQQVQVGLRSDPFTLEGQGPSVRRTHAMAQMPEHPVAEPAVSQEA